MLLRRSASRALHLVAAATTVLLAVAGSAGAARPPLPAGAHALAPGQTPRECTVKDGAINAYGANYGYYFSTGANAWISAPWCYPRWGNLKASGSQTAADGARVTVTAIPTEGSNSGEWAPKTKSIAWEFPGKRAAGCGPSDLSCTVIISRAPGSASTEWQWFQFHVSMPRTFFIDSPGEFCAGVHACPGVATQAWSFVGIRPGNAPPPKQEEKGSISGHAYETDCGDSGSCTQKGLGGVAIAAVGPGGTAHATTKGPDGSYSLQVAKGIWKVTPSLGGREFDPAGSTVTVNGDETANFRTCALARTTQSARTGAKAATLCKKLDVTVDRIKAAGDHGWTQTAGKKYLANKDVPVGFGQPSTNGTFRWQCRSGCFNIRVHVRDSKTHRPIDEVARVHVRELFLGKSVDPLDRHGALCESTATSARLAHDCNIDLLSQVDRKTGDLDFYYWVPAVIEHSVTDLKIEIRAKGYPDVTKTLELAIEPNVAFKPSTITFRTSARNAINTIVPIYGIGGVIDIANYCGFLVTFAHWVATGVVGWQIAQGWKNLVLEGVQLAKKVKSFCGAVEIGLVLPKLKIVSGWIMYWTFGGKFGLPPSGLIGPPSLLSFLSQVVFEYSSFFDEFTGALKAFYFDRAGFLDAEQVGVSSGDTLTLKIYEVSHRRTSGSAQDALYLEFTGTKHGKNGAMRKITPYEAYVEDGYFAGCWLNPKLNQQQVLVADNPCRTEEEEPH